MICIELLIYLLATLLILEVIDEFMLGTNVLFLAPCNGKNSSSSSKYTIHKYNFISMCLQNTIILPCEFDHPCIPLKPISRLGST